MPVSWWQLERTALALACSTRTSAIRAPIPTPTSGAAPLTLRNTVHRTPKHRKPSDSEVVRKAPGEAEGKREKATYVRWRNICQRGSDDGGILSGRRAGRKYL